MTRWTFILKSLRFHGRTQTPVVLSVAAATAVLTGALIVGDSMRGSLRELALGRLGNIEFAMVSEDFFRTRLADELAAHEKFEHRDFSVAAPAILLQVAAKAITENGTTGPHAVDVTLIGCDERFWRLSQNENKPQNAPGDFKAIVNRPLANELEINKGGEVNFYVRQTSDIPDDSTLARKAGVLASTGQLAVAEVLPAEGLAAFSVSPAQQAPRVAFVSLSALQRALERNGRANAIFVGTTGKKPMARDASAIRDLLEPTLDDLGFELTRIVRKSDATGEPVYSYLSLTSRRMVFDGEAVLRAVRRAADSPLPHGEGFGVRGEPSLPLPRGEGLGVRGKAPRPQVTPLYTYLANTIALGDFPRRKAAIGVEVVSIAAGGWAELALRPLVDRWADADIPYSTVTAADFETFPGRLVDDRGQPVETLADDEIALSSWTMRELGAQLGDTITLEYFEPENAHGTPVERVARFKLAAIAPLEQKPSANNAAAIPPPTPFNDPDLTPTVPGITDEETIADWEAPFPYDGRRITVRDDAYWDTYRTTPKAFLTLDAGRALWGSRFGDTTSLRITRAPGQVDPWKDGEIAVLRRRIAEELDEQDELGPLRILPIRQRAVAASAGTTPFDVLFVGFSMFIIAAALLLVVLTYRLGLQRRAAEIGTLAAIGIRRVRIGGMLASEGAIVALFGGWIGVLGGVCYGWLMIVGLRTLWVGAIITPFLTLRVGEWSLLIGYLAGAGAAVISLLLTLWGLRNVATRRLMAGATTETALAARKPAGWISLLVGAVAALAAIALALLAGGLSPQAQAGAFFGAGSLALLAALALAWRWLRSAGRRSSLSLSLAGLAFRGAARNPLRSVLTIGLVGAASFLIVAMGAFQLSPTDQGSGGFPLIAESDAPLFSNPAAPHAAEEYGFSPEVEETLQAATMYPLRLRQGDDASCLNLFRPQQPRVIGVTSQFARHYDDAGVTPFAFSGHLKIQTAEKSTTPNPWRLLPLTETANDGRRSRQPNTEPLGGKENPVPVILDQATALYSLQLYGGPGEAFSVADGGGPGGVTHYRVVGLLSGSVLQGSLLIGEADFQRLFSDSGGYRYFFIDAPSGKIDEVAAACENALAEYGMDVTTAESRLERLNAVQNTYLQTFQSLGGLGLVLGAFGLAAAQVRSVLERRKELALLRAVGFRRRRLSRMILLETVFLIVAGLAVGTLAALITTVPHYFTRGVSFPAVTLLLLVSTVLAAGLLAGAFAARAAASENILAALRGE